MEVDNSALPSVSPSQVDPCISPGLIVMASDQVGYRVVDYLIRRRADIRYLVIDPADRGGFNSQIVAHYQSHFSAVTILSAETLQNPDVVAKLTNCRSTLGILAWWPNILKGSILKVPQLGWLNFHPSYLPFNRGKHPNFWCFVDGTPFGVTLHFINAGIDTGAIVAQKQIPLTWEDTAESVYQKARTMIVELFEETYDDIVAGRLPGREQDRDAGTSHRAKDMEAACCLDLDTPVPPRRLLNILRAKMFPPHPPSYFHDCGKTYAVEIRIKEISTQ